jgi:hypothetical protein
MDSRTLGLVLVAVGALVIIAGIATYFGLLGWFGKLPGDLRYDSGNLKVYAPIVSMLLISLGLSIGLAIVRRLF